MAGIDDIRLSVPDTYITSGEFAEGAGLPPELLEKGLGVLRRRVPNSGFQDKSCLALEAGEKLRDALGPEYMREVRHLSMGHETRDGDDSKPDVSPLLSLLFSGGDRIKEDERTYNVKVSEEKFACLGALSRVVDYLGKRAVVVAADIAEYDSPSAEGTAGAGAAAIAVGEGDLLRVPEFVVENDLFGYSSSHTYDFSKPVVTVKDKFVSSKYPVVDGKFSFLSYLKNVGEAYKDLKSRMQPFEAVSLDSFKGVVLHVPYPKMAEYALVYLRAMDSGESMEMERLVRSVRSFEDDAGEVYGKVKGRLKEFAARHGRICEQDRERLADSLDYPSRVGNSYTASVFVALVSSLEKGFERGRYSPGDRILVIGYGSGGGALAVPFEVTERTGRVVSSWGFGEELEEGVPLSFEEYCLFREGCSRMPTRGWLLAGVDDHGKRTYLKVDGRGRSARSGEVVYGFGSGS